jgi:nucleoside-diphosphate-sugar epimerase
MPNILITGGAGFIPSTLVDALLQRPDNFVVAVDNFLTGSKNNLSSQALQNYRFIKADANKYEDISAIMLAYRFDYVFHYAAVVGVRRTLDHPLLVLEDIDGIKHILSLAKNTGVKRVFFSSSSEVYGEPVEFPQNEHTTPLNSKLPYAIVKNIGEAFCRSYQREHGLDYTIFRFFNTYGPKQSADFVMSKFMRAAIKNEDITIYGDGSQTRTFCFVDDNIEATLRILDEGLYKNDVINMGANLETTILELAKLIIDLTGSKSKVVFLPALEEGDMTRRRPDNAKMLAILNRELVPLREGIKRLIPHFRG